jgi:hypothetical protein
MWEEENVPSPFDSSGFDHDPEQPPTEQPALPSGQFFAAIPPLPFQGV